MTGSPGLSYDTNGAIAYVESGALLTKLANSSINVDVTVADYVSIIGSPNYRLPIVVGSASSLIIGSVAADIQKFGVALPAGTNILGSVLCKISDQSGAVKLWDGTDYVTVEPQGALNVAVNEYYSTFGSNFAADQSNRLFLAGVTGSQMHLSNIFISSENNTTDVYLSFNSTAATAPVHVSHVAATNKEITQTDRVCHVVGPTNGSLFCDCGSGTFIAVNYAYYTP
jgi:hypothetical protein